MSLFRSCSKGGSWVLVISDMRRRGRRRRFRARRVSSKAFVDTNVNCSVLCTAAVVCLLRNYAQSSAIKSDYGRISRRIASTSSFALTFSYTDILEDSIPQGS